MAKWLDWMDSGVKATKSIKDMSAMEINQHVESLCRKVRDLRAHKHILEKLHAKTREHERRM